jgi:Ser/Thr protein kinase RdoA (MazF antagonist)
MSERFTDTFLSSVLADYPLAKPRVLSRLEGSNLNDNFLVADGSVPHYVLRHYRRNPQQDRVAFQLRFQEHLLRCGFPTPASFKTAAGDPFLASREGPWALFAYIEGTPYDPARMEQTLEAARRLAQFHILAETFPGHDVPVAANSAVTSWWAPGAQRLAEIEPLFMGQNVALELDHLRDWLAATMEEWPLARLQALPAGWVHSDYHGRNIVFVDDEMGGLFDFDMLRRDLQVRDVARALPAFSRGSPGRSPLRAEVAQAFVQEYARYRPLTSEEREAIPMMMALDRLPIPGHYAVFQRDGADLAARLRSDLELMRFLQAEGERLLPFLRE